MKNLFFSLLLVLFSVSSAFCLDFDDSLDALAYKEIQLDAITNEMMLFLGWFHEDKEGFALAGVQLVKELESLGIQLDRLTVPSELRHLKDSLLEITTRLQDLYDGIEVRDPEYVNEENEIMNQMYKEYSEEFLDIAAMLEEEGAIAGVPDTVNQTDEELKLIPDEADKELYLKAKALIEVDKCKEAQDILCHLGKRYTNQPFDLVIMIRLSDCTLRSRSDLEEDDPFYSNDEGLLFLSKILDSYTYSPVLYEAFFKWRTATQSHWHGSSNMSHIPNDEYNEKRWQVVQLIKRHFKLNPDDKWALAQARALLSLPNIQRGCHFGNCNIMHWAYLYTDILDEKGEDSQEQVVLTEEAEQFFEVLKEWEQPKSPKEEE